MKVYSKEEIKTVFGSYKWGQYPDKFSLIGIITYMNGFDKFDEFSKKHQTVTIFIDKQPNGFTIKMDFVFGGSIIVGLLNEELKAWAHFPQQQIIEQKSKSVVGRALIGGLLLGPLGAVVGGLSGVGNTNVNITDVQNILSLLFYDENKKLVELNFSFKNKDLKEVLEFFKYNYSEKQKMPDTYNAEKTDVSAKKEISKTAIDELYDLYDSGDITREELQQALQELKSKR